MMPINRSSGNAVNVGILLGCRATSIAALRTMTTEELLAENVYLTGNSRFNSLSVLLAFFICGMIEKDTATLLGYKDAGHSPVRNGRNVAYRMGNIVEEIDNEFYKAFYVLRKAGHIQHRLKWALDPERSPKKGKRFGKNRRNVSVSICETIVARNGGNKHRASKKTGVPVSTIDFWRNLGYKE